MFRTAILSTIMLSACLHAQDKQKLIFPGAKEIEFAKPDGVPLLLDAFVPEGPGPFPACILVHGGGFVRGDRRSYITPIFEPLAKAGFAWFSVDYRLAPKHRHPACVEDVETAIKWVKDQAKEYKIDPDRIALIGESAGGYLASYVGVRGEGKTRVKAVVPFYAPHDRELQVRQKGMGEGSIGLLGTKELNDETYKRLRDISANTYVKPNLPPFLLIHGTKDEQVPYEQSTLFQKKMKEAGNACDLITIQDGGHGMGGWDKLKSDYRERMIDWLKKEIK